MKKIGAIFLAVLALFASPWFGATNLWATFPWATGEVGSQIFFSIRLPRVFLAALCGAALAAAGMVFQGIFRNALACPYTLGVSTGAAFGAALSMRLGLVGLWGLGSSLFAMFGALLTVVAVGSFARRTGVAGMLLLGIVVSLFFSSLIVLLQYMSDYHGLFRLVRWLMGGLETVGWSSVLQVLPFVFLGLAVIFVYARDLDNIALSDELAASRGIQVKQVRGRLFVAVSLMVGAIVSVAGPIGFIGIMVPHFCRPLVGFGHRDQLFWNCLLGAAFLAFCDSVGRALIPPFEIPVGVIMALLGAPFFLWVLVAKRGSAVLR
jgi:iron complex transport system permease protein